MPGPEEIKLNANENPAAVAAGGAGHPAHRRARAATPADPESPLHLREAIWRHHGIDAAQVFVGNGSDEVPGRILAFFQQDPQRAMPDVTYSFYQVYCGLYGIAVERCRWTRRCASGWPTLPAGPAPGVVLP